MLEVIKTTRSPLIVYPFILFFFSDYVFLNSIARYIPREKFNYEENNIIIPVSNYDYYIDQFSDFSNIS